MQSFMTVSANTQNYYFFPEKQSIRRRKTKLFSPTAPPMLHFLSFCDKFSRLSSYCFTTNFSYRFRIVLRQIFRAVSVSFCNKLSAPFPHCFSICFCPNFCLHFRPLPAKFLPIASPSSLPALRLMFLRPARAPDGLLSAFRRNFFAFRRLPPEFLRRCPIKCLATANNDADNQANTNLYINDCL